MSEMQVLLLILIGVFIGSGLGVAFAAFIAIKCGFLPGVKLPWEK